jgi:ThiF family
LINDTTTSHFARIRPIVGTTLATKRVIVFGMAEAAPLVEYLAASGVARWIWQVDQGNTRAQLAAEQLWNKLHVRHGAALGLDVELAMDGCMPAQVCDLILACGDCSNWQAALDMAELQGIPALIWSDTQASSYSPQSRHPTAEAQSLNKNIEPLCLCVSVVSNNRHQPDHVQRALCKTHVRDCDEPVRLELPTKFDWSTICAIPLIAGIARALLLRGTPYERTDLEQVWTQGQRIFQLGSPHPFDSTWVSDYLQHIAQPAYQTPYARRGTVLVAGLGSIGSVAAALLAPLVTGLVLADHDTVEPTNPVRQHYTIADIGQPKACALSAALNATCPSITALSEALIDEEYICSLIDEYGITAALVATGTQADFVIARALRQQGVPHVVARCYPRARYWEAILVDGVRGPSFEDIRGHLRVGPIAPPTPEQVTAYSDAGSLEAEPATLIESGWAAAWAARLTWQLATPNGLRERWLLELLASGQTCLIGGAVVEQTDQGAAYGVEVAGQVWGWASLPHFP